MNRLTRCRARYIFSVCQIHDPIVPHQSYFSKTLLAGGISCVLHLYPLIRRKSRINRAQIEQNTPSMVAGLGIAHVVMADIKCWSDWFHDTRHLIASKSRDKQIKTLEFKSAL